MVVSKQLKESPTRDAEATKQRILNAAEEAFAADGMIGARTEAIAANTGVTKAMLYYYFESKERLYQAVLERAFAGRIKAVQTMDLQTISPVDAMRLLLSEFLNEASRNTNMPAIMFYEAMQNHGKYYREIGISALYTPIANVIERGIKNGDFRIGDPFHMTVNIVGLCAFYFCARENVKHLWSPGTQLLSEEMLSQHKDEAIKFVLAGLRP